MVGKVRLTKIIPSFICFKIGIKTEKPRQFFSDAAFFYLSTVVYAKIEAMVLPISAGESTT